MAFATAPRFLLRALIVLLICCGILFPAPIVYAAPLMQVTRLGKISLSLKTVGKTPGRYQLEVKAIQKLSNEIRLEAFSLENPSRLVVDILDVKTKSAVVKALQDPFLSGLRVGLHPDKMRVVIDIDGEVTPTYRVISPSSKQQAVLEFSVGEAKQTNVAEQPVAPVAKATPSQPATKPEIDETATAVTASGPTVVQAIAYQILEPEKTPAVLITVQNLGNYSLSRVASNLYELVLENTSFAGKHLTLPYFPPDTFEGLEAVVASQTGNNATLKIYVDESNKLNPFRTKGELWLKVVH